MIYFYERFDSNFAFNAELLYSYYDHFYASNILQYELTTIYKIIFMLLVLSIYPFIGPTDSWLYMYYTVNNIKCSTIKSDHFALQTNQQNVIQFDWMILSILWLWICIRKAFIFSLLSHPATSFAHFLRSNHRSTANMHQHLAVDKFFVNVKINHNTLPHEL